MKTAIGFQQGLVQIHWGFLGQVFFDDSESCLDILGVIRKVIANQIFAGAEMENLPARKFAGISPITVEIAEPMELVGTVADMAIPPRRPIVFR